MGGKFKDRKAYIVAQCIGPCKEKKKVYEGDVAPGDMPFCDRCFMPMVAVSATVQFE